MSKDFTIKIGGVPHKVTFVKSMKEVCHNDSGETMWGQISFQKDSIRLFDCPKERLLRVFLHEIIHGVIEHYQIKQLMSEDGTHLEAPIDQLSVGLAEVLESLGVTELKGKASASRKSNP
jgi:hypothetical protein